MDYNPWSRKESDTTELMLLIHCFIGFLTLTTLTKGPQAPPVCQLAPSECLSRLSELCLGLVKEGGGRGDTFLCSHFTNEQTEAQR